MPILRHGFTAALLLSTLLPSGAASDGRAEPRPVRVAVMPSIDLAGGGAPRRAVDERMRRQLARAGFEVVAPERLETVLRRYRMRWTGGADAQSLRRLEEEAGADAMLATSIGLYVDSVPPRVALNARLVSTRSGGILWADAVALAGEDSPGLLGLGRVEDPSRLVDQAVARLAGAVPLERVSAAALGDLPSHQVWQHRPGRRKHRPRRVFRAPELDEPRDRPYRVAVIPFTNLTRRADAGELLAGLFVTHLAGRQRFEVLEPGEVRERLLGGRVIQQQGISLAQADILRELLGAELAVTGNVVTFEDLGPGTTPRVSFSVWVIDTVRRKLVWSGQSANRGDDGVVFFDRGREFSAASLADGMVRAAADSLASGTRKRGPMAGS